MKNKIKKILTRLAEINLFPHFGVELEFYILNDIPESEIKFILEKIHHQLKLEVQQEKGYRQYEIATPVFNDTLQLINYINFTKQTILSISSNISFSPKPYIHDYGSAMHIHMSLINEKNINIFNDCDQIESNDILLYSIGGILSLLNVSLNMIISNNPLEFERLHNADMAPSRVAWGKNNRTTAIRIPDSPPCARNRRIEFRVPSAQSCISFNLLFLLTAAFYGIKNQIQPSICTYGNANDEIYNLNRIYDNFISAQDNFLFWKILNEIL